MRLAILTEGHTLKHKLMLKMLGWYVRADPPDVVRTMLYRVKFFGTPQGAFTGEQEVIGNVELAPPLLGEHDLVRAGDAEWLALDLEKGLRPH